MAHDSPKCKGVYSAKGGLAMNIALMSHDRKKELMVQERCFMMDYLRSLRIK